MGCASASAYSGCFGSTHAQIELRNGTLGQLKGMLACRVVRMYAGLVSQGLGPAIGPVVRVSRSWFWCPEKGFQLWRNIGLARKCMDFAGECTVVDSSTLAVSRLRFILYLLCQTQTGV